MDQNKLNLKVLVAEDYSSVQKTIRDVLTRAGITDIQMVKDGQETVNVIEEASRNNNPFNVALIDWNLPQKNGLEIVRYFRARPEFDPTLFIMLTAETDQNNISLAIQAGVDSYITKPISNDELYRRFLKIIKGTSLEQKDEELS